MTPWDVLLLAVLLSGKVGHGQSFNWPAAAPATVFWHNVVLLIALMRTCVHMCMPRIRDKQSEVEDIQKKMLGKLSDPLVQHRAVFGEKKYRNIWSHDNTTSSPAAAFWLSLCVCVFYKQTCKLDLRDPCWCCMQKPWRLHVCTQDEQQPPWTTTMDTWHIFWLTTPSPAHCFF